ncbi:UBN2_3 domain-containing protein [Cephalotus follicularis]|uniref:UBN2_3 domain-containing protein n=1 Tax=Cephalotus follicularis TaxID=3775 RepID=A0A1Q3AST4_CEPFO|nr:UBN2_3 domain-containing protein [Cephalotus follicularis]
MLSIRAHKLVGYLTGATMRPTNGDRDAEEKWSSEDSMVMYWLVQSIEPSLSKQYIALNTTKDVWDTTAKQYSGENNHARGYDIHKECSEFSQGGLSLVEYYSKLTNMYQQLDSHCSFTPINPTDVVAFQRYMDKLRVWDFLTGLNPEYDPVRVLAL